MLVLETSGDGWEGEPAGSAFLPLHSRDLYCSVSLIFSCFKTWIDMICNGNRQCYSHPRCLGRGAAGSGRTDDNEESLRKRFVTYEQATMPIIRWETIAVCLKLIFLIIFLQAFWEVEPGSPAGCNKVSRRGFCRGWKDHHSFLPVRQSSVEIVTEATSLAVDLWIFTMDYWIAR